MLRTGLELRGMSHDVLLTEFTGVLGLGRLISALPQSPKKQNKKDELTSTFAAELKAAVRVLFRRCCWLGGRLFRMIVLFGGCWLQSQKLVVQLRNS